MIWEDCDRQPEEVYFEVDETFAQDLSCNPHAFLLACAIPAMHFGERRVSIDAEICPELRDGLLVAMAFLRHWFRPASEPVQIEAKINSNIPFKRSSGRSGFFYSGGIDSFAILKANRLHLPLEHPGSFRDGLLVYGLELDKPEAFDFVVDSLSEVAQKIGITLVSVYSNIYLNHRNEDADRGFSFWRDEFMGAALAAVAHALSNRLTSVSIASARDLRYQMPHGSHPLVDPNYSSVDLRIKHDGLTLSRLDRVQLIKGWDVALQNLRVCNQHARYQPGTLNCGHCEKCVRSMLALLALGKLDQTGAFPLHDISEDLARSKIRLAHNTIPYYTELIAPLQEQGRYDLVRVIEKKIARYDELQNESKWKERFRRIDRKYFKGSFRKFKKAVQR